jgi:hypothetical protein
MNIRLLIAEHELVAPVVLDFINRLMADGFGYQIKPIVARNITEAYVMIDEADMAIIDIGEKERELLAVTALIREHIPVIVTSALIRHQFIEDREGFCFLSKPRFDLRKLRQKLEEFAELITANSDHQEAFAI